MKKGMCMMLTLIMAGSLAACGNSQADAGKDETKRRIAQKKQKSHLRFGMKFRNRCLTRS